MLAYAPLYSVPDYVNALKEDTNIDLEASLTSAATIGDQIIASRGRGWDTTIFWGAFTKAVFAADPPVIRPFHRDNIPHWTDANLGPLYRDPKSVVGDVLGAQVEADIWWPGRIGEEFGAMPPMYGIDTFAINPEFVDSPLTSWGDMVDRQWKGRVALQDIPTISVNIWAMYLARSGQIPQPGVIDNLKPAEVDTVMDWMTDHQRAGQFRAFWADYGTSVNLMTSREVYVADIWNAAVFSARQANVPAYYLLPSEGSIAWIGGESIFSGVEESRLPLIYQYLDYRLSGRAARIMAGLAYQTPTYPSEETRNAFETEFYEWNFEGKATYKPITEIVPDKPEWIANGLFDPNKYAWSRTAGRSHSSGNLKDRGSIDTIQGSIQSLETWVDEAPYYIDAWTKFKTV